MDHRIAPEIQPRPGLNVTAVLLGLALAWAAPMALAEEQVVVAPEAGETEAAVTPLALKNAQPYRVRGEDTTWAVASHFLQEPWRWAEAWSEQPPPALQPNDLIGVTQTAAGPRLAVLERDLSTVKLSPQLRSEPLPVVIPTLPWPMVQPFLRENIVLDANETVTLPTVLGGANNARTLFGNGDEVYARGLDETDPEDFLVVRPSQAVTDPVSGEVLGQELLQVGTARVIARGDPSRLQLTGSTREIRVGDQLYRIPRTAFAQDFYPAPAPRDIEGRVLRDYDQAVHIGQYQVISINMGREEGLKPGAVVAIERAGIRLKDTYNRAEQVQLPDERIGIALVFITHERMSFALMMDSTQPAGSGDFVRSPAIPAGGPR